MSSVFRLIFGALVCALFALANAPVSAQGNPCSGGTGGPGHCIDAYVAVNIWVGTVQLYSAGGELLSTTSYITVESSDQGSDPVNSFLAPLQAQSDATYIEDNTALPAIVRDNIASFVGPTGSAPPGTASPIPLLPNKRFTACSLRRFPRSRSRQTPEMFCLGPNLSL